MPILEQNKVLDIGGILPGEILPKTSPVSFLNPITGDTIVPLNPITARNDLITDPTKFEELQLKALTAAQIIAQEERGEPKSTFGKVLDFFQRGQYAAASLVDGLINSDSVYAIGKAIKGSFKELIAPEDRLSFGDLIKAYSPDFARDNKAATTVLGFIGDVAFDPFVWLTFGSVGGVKVSVGAISKATGKSVTEIAKKVGTKAVVRGDVILSDVGKATLTQLRKIYRSSGLSEPIARESAERQISYMLTRGGSEIVTSESKALQVVLKTNKITFAKDFESFRKTLLAPGGISFAGRNVFSSADLSKVSETLGLGDLVNAFKRLPPVQAFQAKVGARFTRFEQLGIDREPFLIAGIKDTEIAVLASKFKRAKLLASTPPKTIAKITGLSLTKARTARDVALNMGVQTRHEYIELAKGVINRGLEIEERVRLGAFKLFRVLKPEQRELVAKTMADVADNVRIRQRELKRGLVPKEVFKVVDDTIEAAGLRKDPVAYNAYIDLRVAYENAAQVEQEAGILNHLFVEYTPTRYKNIRNPDRLRELREGWNAHLGVFFTPDQLKDFKTIADATEKGFDPIMDAAQLYTIRMLESQRALLMKQFETQVKNLFVNYGKIPIEIQDDMIFLKEGLYSRPGAFREMNQYLRLYDKVTSLTRRAATTLRPAFGVKQLFSNTINSYLASGIKTGLLTSPLSAADAMKVLVNSERLLGDTITTAIGEKITIKKLREEAIREGVIRNITIEAEGKVYGYKLAKNIVREIDRDAAIKSFAGSNKAAEGFIKFGRVLSRYFDIPAHIEDLSRLTTYISGRKMGYRAEQARELTNKALFDYLNGLSSFETKFLRRFVLFYTYQRFAIPLVASAAVHTPGRIANLVKTTRTLFEAWSDFADGETLTAEQRSVLPGWLLEQPHAFERTDPAVKEHIFRTFNNFSILDVFSFISSEDNGDISMEETLAKVSLAQLVPLIKVPLEVFARKNFFTGADLPENMATARVAKGDIDPKDFLSHFAATVGAVVLANTPLGSTGGAVAGETLGRIASNVENNPIERLLKGILSWEDGIDVNTGRPTVYVNPYLFNTYVSAVPALSEVFKLADDERTPLERVFRGFFGVGTVSLNLSEEQRRRIQDFERDRDDIVSSIRKAYKQNRLEAADRYTDDLQRFLLDRGAEVLDIGQAELGNQ